MNLDPSTASNVAFWLRQVNGIELAALGLGLSWLYYQFKNKTLKRLLRWNIIWFLLYAVFRVITPVLDLYWNYGYGITSLIMNVVFWIVPCGALFLLIWKIKNKSISLPTLSAKTDQFFDEMFQEVRHNIRRVEELRCSGSLQKK